MLCFIVQSCLFGFSAYSINWVKIHMIYRTELQLIFWFIVSSLHSFGRLSGDKVTLLSRAYCANIKSSIDSERRMCELIEKGEALRNEIISSQDRLTEFNTNPDRTVSTNTTQTPNLTDIDTVIGV